MEKIIISNAIKKNKKIAIAESCTGGLVGSRLTSISGSSEVYEGGVVSYSNQSKIDILGVEKNTVDLYGAVSKEVAIEMADKIRENFSVDYGLSITGIAGPDGGTDLKPVGLVYIGVSSKEETRAHKFIFKNDSRKLIKIKSSQAGLNLLRLDLIYG